jgi:hypothetical protein
MKIGGLVAGKEQIDQRIEYCFDVATDTTGSRLFVAAGKAGLHIFDIQNGLLQYVMTYYDDGYYRNLKIKQNYAYIADSERGLVVVDISGKTPLITWVQAATGAGGVDVKGDKAYVAVYENGLQIFDLSEPYYPVFLGSVLTSGHAWDVWVSNDAAYVADFNSGLSIIDVSVPTKPQQIGLVTWAEHYQTAEIVRGEGDVVYVAASGSGLVIIDVSDPVHPVVVSRYRPTRIGYVEGLAVRDNVVYLTMRSRIKLGSGENSLQIPTIENGLHIIDTANPSSPKYLGKVSFPGMVEGVHLADDIAYVANAFLGVRSIKVVDPENPVKVDVFSVLPVNVVVSRQ